VGRLVCHLVDDTRNLHMPFFRFIERDHDPESFPVTFCIVQPPGPVTNPTWEVKSHVASLGVVSRWRYPVAIHRLVRLLRRRQVAVLHAHLYEPTLIGVVAARLAGVKVVFTRHHSDHNIRTGKRRHVLLDALATRLADRVIAVSEATRELMVAVERAPGEKVITVHNGMDPIDSPDPAVVERTRAEVNPDGRRVILMIARLHDEKGHRVLIDALPQVIESVGPVQVLLAGAGPHREEIAARIRDARLDAVVRLLGRRDDVPVLLALSALVVQPSLAESFGYALVEAMCLGKPIVASRCGGIPEVVGTDAGLLVPMADPQALATAMIDVLRSPEMARRLGEAGRKRAQLFTSERMVRAYEDVYRSVLAP